MNLKDGVYLIIRTHLLFADKINDYIEKFYGPILNKTQFAFGNIKPDIARIKHPIEHTFKGSFDFVLDEVKRYNYDMYSIKNPSVHLGMLSHYMSDFFCSKHYYKDKKGLISHIKYENKLHNTLNNIADMPELSYIKTMSYISGSFSDIIKKLKKEYQKFQPSIENDIEFALQASLIVCSYVLQNSAVVELVKVAA